MIEDRIGMHSVVVVFERLSVRLRRIGREELGWADWRGRVRRWHTFCQFLIRLMMVPMLLLLLIVMIMVIETVGV